MRYLLFVALLGACEKPESIQKRGTLAPQAEEPSPPSTPTPPPPQNETKRFRLTWAKAPRAVTRYDVRFGLTETSVAENILVIETAQNFDAEKPSADVTISADRLAGQSQACFQIVATNAHGTSEPSDARCLALP